jgi:hypothetical protein
VFGIFAGIYRDRGITMKKTVSGAVTICAGAPLPALGVGTTTMLKKLFVTASELLSTLYLRPTPLYRA